jgi:hypothetical protein
MNREPAHQIDRKLKISVLSGVWITSRLCPFRRWRPACHRAQGRNLGGAEEMIGLALLAGVILGLRFRIGLVLTATAAVFALSAGIQIGDDGEAAAALAVAGLCAGVTQVAAFLVLILKHAFDPGAGARA